MWLLQPTNNIIVMSEPSFVDIVFFSLGGSFFQFTFVASTFKMNYNNKLVKFITLHIAIIAHHSFLSYGVTLLWFQFSV